MSSLLWNEPTIQGLVHNSRFFQFSFSKLLFTNKQHADLFTAFLLFFCLTFPHLLTNPYRIAHNRLFARRFYAVPVMVLVATYSIPRYMRSKIVNGMQRCIDFMAYAVFLVHSACASVLKANRRDLRALCLWLL